MTIIGRTADRLIPGWDQISGKKVAFEMSLIVAAYLAYSFVRNRFGSAVVAPEVAERNADYVIAIEQAAGLYFEADFQAIFLGSTTFIQFWNFFYIACHITVAYFALVFLFLRAPEVYRFWRRCLGVIVALGLATYAAFPLMPPRLLGNCGRYGACRDNSPFVDTLNTVGSSLWVYREDTIDLVSNQYAAMPSLHVAWALWASIALVPLLRSRWAKRLAMSYPFLTTFCIIVTGNHFILDAVGGVAVVGVAYWICKVWERKGEEPVAFDSGPADLRSTVVVGATESDHGAS